MIFLWLDVRPVNCLGGQNDMKCQTKHVFHWVSNVKIIKYLLGAAGANFSEFVGNSL